MLTLATKIRLLIIHNIVFICRAAIKWSLQETTIYYTTYYTRQMLAASWGEPEACQHTIASVVLPVQEIKYLLCMTLRSCNLSCQTKHMVALSD